MEVGIRPGHIVFDRTQLFLSKRGTAPKGAQPPVFGSCLLWPNAWMDQDVACYEGRPGDIVLDGDPAPPPERGTAAPHFSAQFPLARSPISATAELL